MEAFFLANMKQILPKDKFDIETAENLKKYSFDEIKEYIPELLVLWLQDFNWPVSKPVSDFLLPYVNEIECEIIKIFSTDDGMWKYWLLRLLSCFPEKLHYKLVQEIMRIAEHPTNDEIDCEVQEEAINFLAELKIL